jgi:hypothetical protein
MSALAGENAMKNNGPCDLGAEVAPDVHVVELTVWDVPSATVTDERIKFVVGVKCPAGCGLGGQEIGIFDQEGCRVGTIQLGRNIWPGTEALYFAEAEFAAPPTAGSHQWEVRAADWDLKLPHASGSVPVTVRVVDAPDCEVTVRAVDRENQTPIKGARVVMHPYRAVTDDNGIAKVRVAKGQYDLLVSGSRYLPACASVEVTADMITSTELDADQPDEDQE